MEDLQRIKAWMQDYISQVEAPDFPEHPFYDDCRQTAQDYKLMIGLIDKELSKAE